MTIDFDFEGRDDELLEQSGYTETVDYSVRIVTGLVTSIQHPDSVPGNRFWDLKGDTRGDNLHKVGPMMVRLVETEGETYTLGSETEICIVMHDADGNGGQPCLSPTDPAPVNTAPTGLPTIFGTAQVGETLTASIAGIADGDGLDDATFAYQWVSNDGTSDTDIEGTTDSTYALVAADSGKTIRVRVTFTDDGGTEETLVSEATESVANPSRLSVADAAATAGDDTALDFVVTLDRAATATVTVDYATADGTATAGEDYTATSGTLTFAAGETTKTVSVPITHDTVEDDGETLTLTLSNVSGADLDDAVGTGTIRTRNPIR